LDRIKLAIGPASLGVKWEYTNVDMLSDRRGFAILRRILILYDLDNRFRHDVDEWAKSYVDDRYKDINRDVRQDMYRMSVRYILEEAALSIRIRVLRRILDEYYMGKTMDPILGVYWGRYLKSAWELAGVPVQEANFSFFEYAPGDLRTKRWRRVEDSSAVVGLEIGAAGA
jgi:hypothetical protein